MKKIDLHTHTNYSFDTNSSNTFESYCLYAIVNNVEAICFTDHIEYCNEVNSFDCFEFDKRYEDFCYVKDKYASKLKLYLGYEVGQPHLHKDIVNILREKGADMIIGSVHYCEEDDYDKIYMNSKLWQKKYNEMIFEMVECANFDVVGHLDVLRKWTSNYHVDIDMQEKIIDKIIEKNIVLEVNTSVFRKGLGYTIPDNNLLEYYVKKGGKYITLGSDCHKVNNLANDFELVSNSIPKELVQCYFEKGKLKKV